MNTDAKRWLVSSGITFATTFLIAVLPFLGDQSWQAAGVAGIVFAGVRAGIKAVAEQMLGMKA